MKTSRFKNNKKYLPKIFDEKLSEKYFIKVSFLCVFVCVVVKKNAGDGLGAWASRR